MLPFLIAIWLGEAIWLSVALAGLAALVSTFQPLFEIIRWAGVIYLLYLAWVLFTSKPQIGNAEHPIKGRGLTTFLSGLAISIGNPENMLFYLALLPSLIDMEGVTAMDGMQLVATLLITLVAIDACWVLLATKARRLLQNSRVIRRINQASGVVMAAAAAAIATR